MAQTIQIKRGTGSLPNLASGELALKTNATPEELRVGVTGGDTGLRIPLFDDTTEFIPKGFFASNLDLTLLGATNIYQVPTGTRLLIDDIILVVDSISGSGTVPTIQLDSHTGSSEIFVSSTPISPTMITANESQTWVIKSNAQIATTFIRFQILTASTYTTHIGTIVVRGHLIPV